MRDKQREEYQIIDGFERLRARFLEDHPDYAARMSSPSAESDAPQRVAEAWMQTVEGRVAATGEARRRLRGLARALLNGGATDAGSFSAADRALLARGADFAEKLELARRARLWPLVDVATPPRAAEEARAWRQALPALGELGAWRFLRLLGRPVLVPDGSLRRFLWRLGLLEKAGGGARAAQAVQSAAERIADLTGIEWPLLETLLRWHAVGIREFPGGRWCATRPRCADCPLRDGCAYARYRPQAEEPALDSSAAAPPEPVRRAARTGELHELEELELLTLLIQRGVAGAGAGAIAEALLRRFGGARGLENATPEELAQVRGVSRARALQIKAALELGRRLAAQGLRPGDPITCSGDVWRAFRTRFRNLPQEHFVVILLDAKNRVIHDQIVTKGSLTGSLAHPREVFRAAVRQAAAGMILLHNHPSGDPRPSPEDRAITARLKEAGEILGIQVLDHIILGAESYYSFKDEA